MKRKEREKQVIYLLREGMYAIADLLIEQYGMEMDKIYRLAFPQQPDPKKEGRSIRTNSVMRETDLPPPGPKRVDPIQKGDAVR